MPPQTPSPHDPHTTPDYDQQPFVAPQISGNDPTYKRRLIIWYSTRIVALLVVLGLLVGGGVAAFTALGGHKDKLATQQTSTVDDTASTTQPKTTWQCSDGYTQAPDNETTCIKADVIDAETTYSCPSGYTKYNSGAKTTCQKASGDYKTETVAATLSYACPSGYSRSGNNCSHTSTKAASTSYTCPSGYALSGTKCRRTSTQYTPAIASCPSGYTRYGTSVTAKCTRTITASKSTIKTCPSKYKLASSKKTCSRSVKPIKGKCPSGYKKVSSTKCTRTVKAGTKTVYKCTTSGYSLSGTKCIRTIGPTLKCAAGYTKSGSGTGTLCKKLVTAVITASAKKICSSGYKLSGSTCKKTTTKKVSSYYACPTGYANVGDTCTRTVGGSVKTAKATVKKACPSGYDKTDNGKCRGSSSETIPATQVQTCNEGRELSEDESGTSICVQPDK